MNVNSSSLEAGAEGSEVQSHPYSVESGRVAVLYKTLSQNKLVAGKLGFVHSMKAYAPGKINELGPSVFTYLH